MCIMNSERAATEYGWYDPICWAVSADRALYKVSCSSKAYAEDGVLACSAMMNSQYRERYPCAEGHGHSNRLVQRNTCRSDFEVLHCTIVS